MKKLMLPYRREFIEELEVELKAELKSNFKDYIAISRQQGDDDSEIK